MFYVTRISEYLNTLASLYIAYALIFNFRSNSLQYPSNVDFDHTSRTNVRHSIIFQQLCGSRENASRSVYRGRVGGFSKDKEDEVILVMEPVRVCSAAPHAREPPRECFGA